jgi:nickel/cobalt exporter
VSGVGVGAGLGVLGAAAVLGVTHGFEPDHAAGISALTSDADRWTHAAFVGGSFALGHVLVVLAWVAVLLALGQAASNLSGTLDRAGTLLAGTVLFSLALLLATTGSRRLRGLPTAPTVAGDGGPVGRTLALAHSHLHRHDHQTRADYLRTGVVGSLFALSPPVSMLALVSAVLPTGGVAATGASVAVYAVALTTSMVLVGSGLGSVFSLARGVSRRAHAAVELSASVVVLGFAVHLLV